MFLIHPAPHDQHASIPARHGRPGRSLVRALCLVAVMAVGGILVFPVTATSEPVPPDPTGDRLEKIPYGAKVRLELTPADDEIWLGESRTYTATAVVTVSPNKAAVGSPDRVVLRRDVTGLASFVLKQGELWSDPCERATCKPETAGLYTVEGVVPKWFGRLLVGTTSLRAQQPVKRLELTPAHETIQAGGHVRYSATGLAGDDQRLRNVTRDTTFTATPKNGPLVPCRGPVCGPTAAGDYTVTGTLQEKGRKPVTGTATLTVVPGEPTALRLDPTTATVEVGVGAPFRAVGEDRFGNPMNRTEQAEVTIVKEGTTAPDGGSCAKAAAVATCKGTTPDTTYVVTATLRDPDLSATARLVVRPEPIKPSIQSVTPESGSPNTVIVVTGTTGSCGRTGTLTLEGTDIAKPVEGDFTTRFKVPSGTAPSATRYRLALHVTCDDGRTKQATHPFEVSNQPPRPVDDPDVTVLQDDEVSYPVTDNDGDPDDPDGYDTALESEQPDHGATEVVVEEGKPPRRIRYTPDKGFSGPDQFQYRLCDVVDAAGDKQCDTATVTVTVNVPEPGPVDDPGIRTRRDRPRVVDVMGNDHHPDAARLRVLRPERPGARAEKLPNGKVRYTPEPGRVGEDRFRYDYCGSAVNAAATAACPTATVTVTVEPPDGATRPPEPEPVDDPGRTTAQDQPMVVDVTGNDRHPDVATLRVKDQPANGRAEKLPGGAVRYTPDKGVTGTDTFTYDYCGDAPGAPRRTACPSATVVVTVEPREPPPPPPPEPEPVDDPDQTTARDRPVVIDVMGNDRNPMAARLRVREQPAGGAAEKLADGTVRYTPEAGSAGADAFTYDYCGSVVDVDRQATCPSATVSVTVTSDPVITSIRPGFASPGTSVRVAGSTGSCNRAGTLTLQETGAAVRVPADQKGNFTASLTVPKGTPPRAYTLELGVDCQGQSQRAEGRLTVTNQAPAVADDAATTTRGHAVEIPVTRNDRDPDDPDGYPTRVLASPPGSGSADVRDQTIVYTPAADFIGQDQFTYSLCDDILNAAGQADCGTGAVTVSVTDTPSITSVSPGSAKPGTPVVVVGSTGSCNRAGTLTLEGTGVVAQAAAEQNGNFTTLLTIPDGTFPREYRLTLRIDCNGQLQQAEGALSVTNERPQPADDVADTVSDAAVAIQVTGNDRDPDDPDGYPTRLMMSGEPAHGTAEVQSEQTILYTPERTFVGEDRFTYSLCDDTLNAAGQADCGAATVTVTVSDSGRCLAGDPSSMRVNPGKGREGAKLDITATVDPKLAGCPFKLLLGGTTLGADVRARDDGGITAQRAVPGHAQPGKAPVKLATVRGQVLAETPFEITRPFSVLNLLFKALLGAAALLTGALARAAFRWLLPNGQKPAAATEDGAGPPEDVRVEGHPSPAEVAAERVPDGTQTHTVRLEPHRDPGTQRLQEVDT